MSDRSDATDVTDRVVVHLPAAAHDAEAAEQALLTTVLETAPRTVVLVVADGGQWSSSTFSALLWARRRCAARGIQVLLRPPPRRGLEALRRSGLLDLVALEPTTPEAAS